MYKIITAEHAGFCFGVDCATKAAVERAVMEGTSSIFTLGRIIHNSEYTDKLRSRGVGEITSSDIESLFIRARKGEDITVIIRAHGEIDQTVKLLKDHMKECQHFKVIDCTCPFVTQKYAR
jgi:4-hydroxy-3-methylbut-2-enyl diphosphate reductase IspH